MLHGAHSYLLQDADGQIALTHSISAGLDYALVGPEHAMLHDQKRAEYCSVTDQQALDAARTLARTEGIIPALESAHAVAEALRRAPAAKGELFVINLSGRGDKDTDIYRENLKELDAAQTRISRLFDRLAGGKAARADCIHHRRRSVARWQLPRSSRRSNAAART